MKYLLFILLLPFFVCLILWSFLLAIGESINIIMMLSTLLLLFINGYGLSKDVKKWNIIGFVSIIIFSIWYGIQGYFDAIRWTSTKIAIILLIFYVDIFILRYLLIKKKNKKQ